MKFSTKISSAQKGAKSTPAMLNTAKLLSPTRKLTKVFTST